MGYLRSGSVVFQRGKIRLSVNSLSVSINDELDTTRYYLPLNQRGFKPGVYKSNDVLTVVTSRGAQKTVLREQIKPGLAESETFFSKLPEIPIFFPGDKVYSFSERRNFSVEEVTVTCLGLIIYHLRRRGMVNVKTAPDLELRKRGNLGLLYYNSPTEMSFNDKEEEAEFWCSDRVSEAKKTLTANNLADLGKLANKQLYKGEPNFIDPRVNEIGFGNYSLQIRRLHTEFIEHSDLAIQATSDVCLYLFKSWV